MADHSHPCCDADLKNAINTLVYFLKTDSDYRGAWKDNIAMAFKDECRKNIGQGLELIDTIANDAADNFLNNLVRRD